jgi:hypothetical protein
MKVLFLDIDGVLNSHSFWKRRVELAHSMDDKIDPLAVQRLNRLTDETGAKIVVSSTWRLPYVWSNQFDMLATNIKNIGITAEVIGMTPDHKKSYGRGGEIQAWMTKAWEDGLNIESFVIIDDDSDMDHLLPFLVKTTFTDGLQEEHIESAIKILSNYEKESS